MPAEAEPASQLSARIEDLAQRVEAIADPAVRANATALVQSLLELHARAFARIGELLAGSEEPGRRIFAEMADDDLLGGLLLLYGQHPESVEARVAKAVGKLEERLRRSGNGVELLSLENGIARLRVTLNGGGCGSSEADVARMVEETITTAAPEIARVEVETRGEAKVRASELVQLQVSMARQS